MSHTLETQIRHLADEAETQLDAPADVVDLGGSRRPQRRRELVLAAAVAVILTAGLAGIFVLNRVDNGQNLPDANVDESMGTDLPPVAAEPPPVPENTPNIAVADDETWFAFDELPEGFRFLRAVDYGSMMGEDGPERRSVEYESVDETTTITVSYEAPAIGLDEPTESLVIDGETWTIGQLSSSGRNLVAVRGEATEQENNFPYYDVTVIASEVTPEFFVTLLERVAETTAADLPRAPLPATAPEADVVARATQDGNIVLLRAVTDGRSFTMSYGTGSGGGGAGATRLGSEWIVVDGAAGPSPGLVADGEAESLIYGLVHPDVAEVAVELTDGTLIRSAPQDEYGFEENFFLIAFPTATEGGLEQLASVVAYDADGNELQRDTTFAE